MIKPIRFGIIGCGMIAKWHANALRAIPDAEIGGACDPAPGRGEEFTRDNGGLAYPDVKALLSDPLLDAVCICTPSGTHAPLILEAANAGKHIVVEKPMAITMPQVRAVLDVCAQKGVKVCCISQLRFTKGYQTILNAVKSERLGRLVCGDVFMKYYREEAYYAQSSWRGTFAMDGGGALMNQGIHGVDLLQSLMGPVRSVFARSRTLLHNIEAEDTLTALLEYENGALGVIQATTSAKPGYGRRIELNGTKGSVTLTEDRITSFDIDGQPVASHQADGGVWASSDPTSLADNVHVAQLSDMVQAIRQGRPPLVDEQEGKKALEIILAVYESVRTGQPVELKEFRGRFL